jgi:adenosine deaminase CECR1
MKNVGHTSQRLCVGALAVWLFSFHATAATVPQPQQEEKINARRAYLASPENYDQRRHAILRAQRERRFCAGVELNADEKAVDAYLESLRNAETAPYMTNGQFPPARHFSDVKTEIERSPVFPILRKMPKGGALHVHWPAIGPVSWIVSNATYRPDCFVRWMVPTNDPARGQLNFYSKKAIATNGIDARDAPAQTLRAQLQTQGRSLDRELESLYTLHAGALPTSKIWIEFGDCFMRIWNFATFQPLFRGYLTAGIESFLDDEVQYIEIRTPVVPLTDLAGRQWADTNFLQQFIEVRNAVRARRAKDFNLKIIVTGMRNASRGDVRAQLASATRYQNVFPDLVIGFDLVGDEDAGHSTRHDASVLYPYTQTNHTLHFFFHDGESDWPHDNNLIDAVLLGSKRIGHGFNLFRSPMVEEMIREQGIVLEVCPISNQAVRLARDIRLHPAAGYLKRGVQCVLSSDDPGIIGNHGLSYDFWEAFMAWDLDLAALKQLAENSLVYSGMTDVEKKVALASWKKKWNAWIAWVNDQH